MRTRIFPHGYSTDYAASPAAPWLTAWQAWLEDKGFCTTWCRAHINMVRRVLETHGPIALDTHFAESDLVRLFRSRVRPQEFRWAQQMFAQFLRDRGQWSAAQLRRRHSELLEQYESFLIQMRGIAPSTTEAHLRTVQRFLNEHCGAARELSDLQRLDVERFIARKCKRCGRSALQSVVAHLRQFLRYCQDRGLLATALDQIDTPRKYRDERPPRAIPWDSAQALLSSINRLTRMGCRDHAMLYLMTFFGLRTGEVCSLKLEDVDLGRQVLRVSQSKTHQILTLPLTPAGSRVLTRYLAFGRPRTQQPYVFLTMNAPIRPLYRSAIAAVFQRRVQAAGLPLTQYAPYCLRHGLAMRLLGRGVGIKAIGDLLGHRTLDSTGAYLRINTEAMREVALGLPRAWLGGAA